MTTPKRVLEDDHLKALEQLGAIYDASRRLREWLLCPGLEATVNRILSYYQELHFSWGQIYLVEQKNGDPILRLAAKFGLQQQLNQDRFQGSTLAWTHRDPDRQPWHLLDAQIDLAVFQIDPTVPAQEIRELSGWHGVRRFGIPPFPDPVEFKQATTPWLEVLLQIGEDPIGKLVLSLEGQHLDGSDREPPLDLEWFQMQALSVAIALSRASQLETQKQLRQKLAEAEIQKRAYWRRVSIEIAHQIKNPLAAQAQFIDRLGQEQKQFLTPNSRALVERIQQTNAKINTLMTRILELASTTQLRLQNCSALDLLKEAWAHVKLTCAEAQDATWELDASQNVHALADPQCLLSVFQALLTNATQFGRTPDRDLRIKCQCLGPFDAGIGPAPAFPAAYGCIILSDAGIGLPEAVLGNLEEPFKPFSRGTGLGLAIAWHQVQRMGGQLIYAKQAPGGLGGATFIIALNLATANS